MKFPYEKFQAKRKGNVNNLWDSQNKILHLATLGYSNDEISAAIGVSSKNVSEIRNSKIGKDKLEVIRAARNLEGFDTRQRILDVVPKAMQLLEDIIDGVGDATNAPLALRAKYADKHLARAGLGEIKTVATLTGKLTRDDIERIKQRAQGTYENIGE